MQQLQELTKVLKVEDCICFVGPCYDESELGRLFLSSDICVVPSAAGLSVMHAMAFGLPVITDNNFSRHGPEVEAVDEEVTGGFYQAGSLESLSDKVIEWGDKVQSDRDGVIKRSCIEKVEKSYTAERQVQLICAALNYGDEK